MNNGNGSGLTNSESRLAAVSIRKLYLYGHSSSRVGVQCRKAEGANNSTDQLVVERAFVYNTATVMQIEAECSTSIAAP